MATEKKRGLTGSSIALIVFAVLLVALIIVAICNVNLIVTYILVFLMMFDVIFGILPHSFDAM